MAAAHDQLAIHGGPPTISAGPPSWPVADEQVRAALDAAYADGSWGRYDSNHGPLLAGRLCELHNVEHALLCASGTLAVELALRGLKIGEGDEVILAGYDFSGNFRAIESVGARPVLVDIDPRTWCLDAAELLAAFSPQSKAVIVSHLHGNLADMRQICDAASQRGVAVVEDACQSPGAIVAGKPAGTWGDVGVLSFGGSKLLTAGRGGAVLTRHADVHQRIKIFCQRGNHAFPLSELQAAVLLPQIDKLADRNIRRADNVRRLLAATSEIDALVPLANEPSRGEPVYYKLPWLYRADRCSGVPRDTFIAAVRAEGVALDAGFRGFVRRPASVCRKVGELPHSTAAAADTVLLHHPVLLEPAATIDLVATALRKVISSAASL